MNSFGIRVWVGALVLSPALLLLPCGLAPAATPPPSTAPVPVGPTEVEPRAKALLDQLLLDESLSLRGDERFAFRLTMTVPVKGGSTHSSTFLVARDKDALAMLVVAPDGSPYAFATNELFAGFSPTAPGRLIVCTRGAPAITLAGDEADGHFNIDLSFSGKAEQARVAVDLRSVIRTAAAKLLEARYDEKSNALHLTTPNGDIWLPLVDEREREPFPITGLIVRNRKGFSISVSDLTRQPRWPELLSIRKAGIEGLGLPMHVLGEKEAPLVPLFVPSAFRRTEKERRASDRFRTLFPSLPAPNAAPATPRAGGAATAPARDRTRKSSGQQVSGHGVIRCIIQIDCTGGC